MVGCTQLGTVSPGTKSAGRFVVASAAAQREYAFGLDGRGQSAVLAVKAITQETVLRVLTTGKLRILRVVLALCSLSVAGCLNTGTAQLYPGPKRPQSETATVFATPGMACPEIRSVDGVPLISQRNVELLPGEKIIEVYCREIMIRDPLGGWYGHEVLRVNVDAGHEYELRAKTQGSGRAFSYGSRCTMWIVDKATNRKVSELLERKTRVQR